MTTTFKRPLSRPFAPDPHRKMTITFSRDQASGLRDRLEYLAVQPSTEAKDRRKFGMVAQGLFDKLGAGSDVIECEWGFANWNHLHSCCIADPKGQQSREMWSALDVIRRELTQAAKGDRE